MQIKAIVVDDSWIEREMIVESMDWNGMGIWICATAQNGIQGLKLFESERPDLVITDILMPEMDGIEMVDQILEIDKKAAVVFLSNYACFEYAQAGFVLGVKNYILKQDLGTEKTKQFFEKLRNEILEQKFGVQDRADGAESGKKERFSPTVEDAMAYMKEHLSDKQLDMKQVAEEVALSSSRFRAVFKAETGCAPSQYMSELRFKRAEQLLLETRMTMDVIADQVGFSDGRYFRKAFRQKYGMTPREFRDGKGKPENV